MVLLQPSRPQVPKRVEDQSRNQSGILEGYGKGSESEFPKPCSGNEEDIGLLSGKSSAWCSNRLGHAWISPWREGMRKCFWFTGKSPLPRITCVMHLHLILAFLKGENKKTPWWDIPYSFLFRSFILTNIFTGCICAMSSFQEECDMHESRRA